MKIIIMSRDNPVIKKEAQPRIRTILPPARERAKVLRPRKKRNYLGPLLRSDFKYVSDILHSHCLSHCNMTYGKGTCLNMECYKTLRKIDRELDKD